MNKEHLTEEEVWAIGRPYKSDPTHILFAKFVWRNAIIICLIIVAILFGVSSL